VFRLIVRHSYDKVINKIDKVQRNNEERLQKDCSCGKTISVTYSDCVFVASCMQQAMGIGHIFICGLPGSTIFFVRYILRGKIFGRKFLHLKCMF
jgi:hypothetical protein